MSVTKLGLSAAAALLLGLPTGVRAGSFVSDFNAGLPEGSAVYGNTTVSTDGGYTNSGCLQLTTTTPGSQNGGFIITNDLDAGVPVTGFTASFKVLIGGGTSADGMSFNFAPDLPLGTITEEGAGSGLIVEFDTHSNGGSDPAPAIGVKVWGSQIASAYVYGLRTGTFVDAVVQLNPDNTLTVIYDSIYIFQNLNLAAYGYSPAAGSLFGFGARTGGSVDNHFIDNLCITTRTNAGPFVSYMAPVGRHIRTDSPLDVTLTDFLTQVQTNTIALSLDGVAVSPTLTQDGNGNTFVHFAPSKEFPVASTHAVSLSYRDNGSPAQTYTCQYVFNTLNFGAFTTVLSDTIESYLPGFLDKNPLYWYTGNGPNYAPNGSGNPWFGGYAPNAHVVGAETGVTPHSGTNMLTGNVPYDGDQNWCNLVYRFHSGQPIYGNCALEWWFYDPLGPVSNGGDIQDYMALACYATAPANTDYPTDDALYGSLNTAPINNQQYQRLSLGISGNTSTGFDPNLYQARIVYQTAGFASGWVNLSVGRSIGWHHARIMLGDIRPDNTTTVYFYLDDMTMPRYVANSVTPCGINVAEINSGTAAILGYFDDISFAVATPATLRATAGLEGSINLSWTGGFTLQSAPTVNGPWSDLPGATSPFSTNSASLALQFFRLKN